MDDFSANLAIDTPENILLNAEIAGFGTRCIAAFIDYTILIVLILVVIVLFARASLTAGGSAGSLLAIRNYVLFILFVFYHLVFELFWGGQTPGKRAVGIRVVQSNGLPLTAGSAIIRNFVRLFDFLPVIYGIGLITMFLTKNTQRLGDLAARTVVIRERRQLTLTAVKESVIVHYLYIKNIDPIPPYIRIDRLTADDQRAVLDYLGRRATLRNRSQIAPMIAARIVQKLDDPVAALREIGYSTERAEKFLEFVARAFEVNRPE